ncbi:MAG: GNAT family N-acetyltransferase [Ruminococcaceae bacterium]|nr:GNAT family N-acetyltransferase [Oscillospiraceae bacterium]
MIKDYLKFFKYSNKFLETPRLILRPMRVSDRDDMYDYASREEVTKYLLWRAHASRDHTQRYLSYVVSLYKSGEFFDFAIEYRENGKMIGTCGFAAIDEKNDSVEVGYVISPDYRGMGIAAEALDAVLRLAFCDMSVNRVEARYMSENGASRRVMEKCGMIFEGINRQKLLVKGEYRDIGVCSILASEYFGKNEKISAISERRPRMIGIGKYFTKR